MKERPILFSGGMVQAILEGRKTQTRRVIKHWPERGWHAKNGGWLEGGYTSRLKHPWLINTGGPGKSRSGWLKFPYGGDIFVNQIIGTRLWVRETHHVFGWKDPEDGVMKQEVVYRADPESDEWDQVKWTPSIFMKRQHSRITLEITDVRVERVQDITEADAQAEGAAKYAYHDTPYRYGFQFLWNFINDERGFGWDVNPWVWVVEFRRVEGGL